MTDAKQRGLAGPLRLARDPRTWRSALYLLASPWIGLVWLVLITTGVSLGLALAIIWVGLPLLAVTMLIWRGGAIIERRLLRATLGAEITRPYRPMPQGAGPLTRWRLMAADPATWKDLAYLVLLFPIGLVEFVVSVVLWSVSLWAVFLPLTALIHRRGTFVLDLGVGPRIVIDSPLPALPWAVFGLLALALTLYAVRGMAATHAGLARRLLGPSEAQELRARAARLQASRARGVDAAEAERRRIERDLHDGAQQHLLAVAMDLGRARAKLDDDPATAKQLIELAHQGTKEVIAELRNLARGIYPAILTDRGLDAALSALAARCPVPVEVEVELPGDRPPAAVESIAYFVVAEALTNIAKYARATRATVRVSRDAKWVVVEVSDNGVGGATVTPGGGLAGLADRAATIDGILTVDSPTGGPTVVRADLPCTW